VSQSPAAASDQTLRDRWQGIRAQLRPATPVPEDSISLRVLVQLLVSVGIASISVAAAGVTQTSLFNLLAIPLSALGGYWSWRSRRQSNMAVKFAIAFGMLMALGVFLTRLLGEGGDARIRLAELLIHLQILHSFDMPRRKDLGYSIVIGLILLGVAATVSQTLTFAPILVIFLAIALPVLILDYRSRLGLVANVRQSFTASLRPRRLAALGVLIIGLGLAIFAVLPRLPGYQFQNFPVSETINFQGEFSGNQILNPGYTSDSNPGSTEFDESEAGGAQIQGGSPVDGPGEMDDSTYYGFNQQINQNLRGTLKPQVVMRVRSQAPGFWRVLAFNQYTGQGWRVSQMPEVEVLERSSSSYQTFLPAATVHVPRRDEVGRRRNIIQTYTMVNDLPNLIPALYQARELYFPTRQIAIDAEGSLRAPLSLTKGLTFTVVSKVPYRDRTQLRTATTDYPDITRETYLQMPAGIRDRIRQQTETLLARSPNPLTDPYEQALFLAQSLKQNYTIQAELPFFETGEDLVESFLFRYEGGYPDHFSTVLTVMLRSIGIPARLVTGFGVGQFNPFTGYYVVNNTDAYAVTEVYFPGYGWFAFDPIPGHELMPPSIRDSQTFGVLRQFWNWVAGWLPSPVSGWLGGVFSRLADLFSRLMKFFTQSAIGVFVGLLSAVGLAFLGWLGWQGWQRWRRQARLRQLPPIERLYQQLLNWLADQGYPKRPTQTPLEYAIALHESAQFAQAEQVMTIVHAYLRWRYGRYPEDPDQMRRQIKALRTPRSRRR